MKGDLMREERFYIGAVPAILYGAPADRGYLFLHGQMGRKEEARAFAQVVCHLMREERFYIGAVPAILYGAPADRGYLFLHGQMGRKEEARAFAQVVCPGGFQVLSIDLPGHGARQDRGEELFPWTAAPDIRASLDFAKHRWNTVSLEELFPWTAAPDIRASLDFAKHRWNTVSLRATSIGAYVALLAFDASERVLLVSPVLDMEALIQTMMGWAGVSEKQLREQGEIAAPSGQTLSWRYLCWVREHPIWSWSCPIHILYGSEDALISRQTVEAYARQHSASLTVMEGGEHWFHTPEQTAFLRQWETVSSLPDS